MPLLLSLALAGAAAQAQKQMHDIGHNRDTKTKMARTKDFTPPLLGTAKLANFTLTSRLSTGAYMIAAAVVLQFFAAWLNRVGNDGAQRPKEHPLNFGRAPRSAEGRA